MRVACLSFLAAVVMVYGWIPLISASVFLKSIPASFPDLPAKSAAAVSKRGICGALFVSDPLDACSSPPRNRVGFSEGRFVLIVRGNCSFEEKLRNAQTAGFRAAIVYDDRENEDLLYMMVRPEGLTVHAVFVSKGAGETLRKFAKGEDEECCIYPPQNGRAWTVLAISFFSLVVMIGCLLIVFFAPRQWLRWQGRNQGPKSVDAKLVKTLPCFTFSSARTSSQCHAGETCAICLEDYRDGDTLRLLPCQHAFHSSCVDSWLTKWGTFCPVCKLDMRTKYASSQVNRGNVI